MKKLIVILMTLAVLIAALMLTAATTTDTGEAAPPEPEQATQGGDPTEAVEPTAVPEPTEAAVNYPLITGVTPDSDGFTVKWSAYPDAVKYRIFVRGESGWIRVGDTAGVSLRHRNLSDQTSYTYTVRALDDRGKYMSDYCAEGWSNVFLSAPVLLSAAPSGNAMQITWEPKDGVDCYRVYRKEGAAWTVIGYADDGSFTDEQVQSGKTYTYTVKGFTEDRQTILTAYRSTGISGAFVSMPVISGISARNAGVRIEWKPSPGADRYRVFVKNQKSWKRIADTYDTGYTYTKAPLGVATTYTVRAMNADGRYVSDFLRAGKTHTALAAPKLLALTNTASGQKLTWQQVVGCRRYLVYVRNGSAWEKLAETASCSYTATGLNSGAAYAYTVRCLSPDGRMYCSGFNASGLSRRYYAMPVISAAESERDGARITWNRIEGVPKYRVFVRSGSTWTKLGDVTGTSYLHTKAVQGTTYTYTVRAFDSSGYISAYDAAGYTGLYQTAPLLRNVIPSSEGTMLAWDEFNGAQRYRVYRRTLDTKWKGVVDVDGFTYTDVSAPKGVPCQYTLKSVEPDGTLTSDYFDNNLFYVDGTLADGEYNINGWLVTFSKGKITKGYVTAQDIIRIAQAEVGTKATNYKRCKYNTWYYGADVSGSYYEWCVVFVEWVFQQAGARDLLYEKTAGTEFFGQGFYERGRLIKSGFRVGDLLILHWKDGRSAYVPGFPLLNHVGIIIAVNDDGSYTTIEGNTGDNPNGEVMIKRRYPELISGACRPAYGFTIPAE